MQSKKISHVSSKTCSSGVSQCIVLRGSQHKQCVPVQYISLQHMCDVCMYVCMYVGIYIYICVFSIIIYVYLTVEEPKNTMYVYMYMHACGNGQLQGFWNLYTRVLHQIYIPCIIAITSWKGSKHPSHVYNSKQATSSGHPFIPAYSNDPTGIQLASINSQNNHPASPLIIHMIRKKTGWDKLPQSSHHSSNLEPWSAC